MIRTFAMAVVFLVAMSAAACGPADVSGNYSISATNTATNSCAIPNWMAGASATGVGLGITQTGSNATGMIQGLAGTAETLEYGTDTYVGTVSGSGFTLTATSRPMSNGNCAYTFSIVVEATINGDTLTGTRTFHGMTNNGSDCGALNMCQSIQNFNGTRPPPS